jgi:hypothetical protein
MTYELVTEIGTKLLITDLGGTIQVQCTTASAPDLIKWFFDNREAT